MGDRLNDDQLREAAARRPGYATYPEYRPGRPERLGRLPAVTGRDSYPSTATITAASAPEVPTGPAPAAAVPPAVALDSRPPAPGRPQPDYLIRWDRSLTDEEAAEIKARWQERMRGGVTLEALPPSPVFDFQPCLISERPWWRRRWHWAVMAACARIHHGYAWTEGAAVRRTGRAARRAGRG